MPTHKADPETLDLERAYAAKEVQQFLAHAAIQRAFQATEAAIAAEWQRGTTVEDREAAFAKLQGFRAWKAQAHALATRVVLTPTRKES